MKKLDSDKDLDKIVTDCKKMGYNIRIRDISYVYLCQVFKDSRVAYKTLFGSNAEDKDADDYHISKYVVFLRGYIEKNYMKDDNSVSEEPKRGRPKKEKVSDGIESITFDENRRGMEDDLRSIEKLIKDSGDSLDAKELSSLIKTKADLRVKLNDKFGAGEKNEEQLIIVEPKFNFICPHTSKECYVYTKEDLIKEYDLVERR